MVAPDVKKVFLLVGADVSSQKLIAENLKGRFEQSALYYSSDGTDALLKIKNVTPHVLFTELELPKFSGSELIRTLIKDKQHSAIAIVVLSDIPDQESFVDEVVSGRLQFLHKPIDPQKLNEVIGKALNRSALGAGGEPEFRLKFLSPGEILFRQGDPADCAFLVKKGKLRAYKKDWGEETKTLGEIMPGEFVGEMAHINGEPRSADVEALEECELIEIPLGTLDMLLFSKPAWSKALMKTLSKRLKSANNPPKEKK